MEDAKTRLTYTEIRQHKDYIEQKKKDWVGTTVWYGGKAYKVVDVDYNGALMLAKKAQFTDTTAVPEAGVKPLTRKEYYATRKPFVPEYGHVYDNAGGGQYKCTSYANSKDSALFRNVKSGWHFVAHGIGIYADGKIDWDYSTSGSF